VEDTANVNLIVEPCNRFLGKVKKQQLPIRLANFKIDEIKRSMKQEIEYFYNLETHKRKRIN
jgi:hypothetical protein